jgi:two-component system, LuxR family, response regulator FixJ
MRTENKKIFFVNNDSLVYKEICTLLDNISLNTCFFTNPADCLERLAVQECSLLIANYEIPEMNGIELMKKAKRLNPLLPVIIIADNGNISMAVSAIKEGAIDFLVKPLDLNKLVTIIRNILQNNDLCNNIATSLTRMERLILSLLVRGKNNKEIAFLLKRSKRTIENHHFRLMKKLEVHNCAELYKTLCFNNIVKAENDSM